MRSHQQRSSNLTLSAILLSVTVHLCIGFCVQQQHQHRYPFQTTAPQHNTRITHQPPLYVSSLSRDHDTTIITPTRQEQQQQQQQLQDLSSLPFRSSIAGPDAPLTFAPFWDWHTDFLESSVAGLRAVDCSSRRSLAYSHEETHGSFTYRENERKGARIYNRCFESDDFRKIRTTYYDAGHRCQVFNALWYPRNGGPVLGVDLLAFGSGQQKKRYLAIVDFQPMDDDDNDNEDGKEQRNSRYYEQEIMAPIRKQYPALQGRMTTRFYDETRFFSEEMLFGRFQDDDQDSVAQLFPAFTEYVVAYSDLVQRLPNNTNEAETLARQAAYDSHSADRDPAKKMFENVFGKEWAEEFVHGFLFSLSSPEDRQDFDTTARNEEARHQHHRQVAGLPQLRVEEGIPTVMMKP